MTNPCKYGNISLVVDNNGSLAQLGEHLPYKQRVTGSSPVAPTYGEIAQLARARGSYPRCRGFESLSRYLLGTLVGVPFLFIIFGGIGMGNKKRNTFSGTLGFILAAAGSAVGLGNIWRFPYLAAKDGGGLFLAVYLVLALTFGFTLLITEIAIGRKTKQGPLTAYGLINKKFTWIGYLATIVPFLIMPYYCVIGGWVLKYAIVFLSGSAEAAAQDGYFTGFITGNVEPIIYNVIFLVATAAIIYKGVNKGIELVSKFLMPILFLMIIIIAVFSLTLKGTHGTGLDGFLIYTVPSVEGKTFKDIFVTVMDAMGQLFYSISVAMGIMVAFGSYYKSEANIIKAVNHIELFDTVVAFLAGMMIIPTVYVYMGRDGMQNSGPGLMFDALPKVFVQMGSVGTVIGAVFFLMVLFAALTSSASILEAIVSGMIDRFGMSRKKATISESITALIIGIIVCLGYNLLYFEVTLPNSTNGSKAQILDILDYVSNSLLMPIVAFGTCILIGWVAKPKIVTDEVTRNGEKFFREKLYFVMIKFVAPLMLGVLFLGSLGVIK